MTTDTDAKSAVALSRLYDGAQFCFLGSSDVFMRVKFDPDEDKFLVCNMRTREDSLLDGTTATFMTQ